MHFYTCISFFFLEFLQIREIYEVLFRACESKAKLSELSFIFKAALANIWVEF